MCVLSMVFDQFHPIIPRPYERGPYPAPLVPWTPYVEPAKVRKILDLFAQMQDLAKKVDELTGQKDCLDAEKAKLMERVEELEKLLAERGEEPRHRTGNVRRSKPKGRRYYDRRKPEERRS